MKKGKVKWPQQKHSKKKRTTFKTKLTKFSNFIEIDDNRANKTEIKLRLDKVTGLLDEFEQIQTQIDELTGEASDEYDAFENSYYSIISTAHDIIELNNVKSENSGNQIANNASVASVSHNVPGVQYVNNPWIPKFELPKFDGSYDKWLDFHDSFKSMVHSSSALNNIQKLHCLKRCLIGEAEGIISSIETTESNFNEAWEILMKRYNNKRLIVVNHIRNLMEIPSISKESHVELRKFLDTIRTHIRALKSLQEPVDKWDSLLIYTLTLRIDRNSHKEWEKSITDTEMPTLEKFLSFLEMRCQVLQATAVNMHTSTQNPSQGKSQNNQNKQRILTATQNTTSCPSCQGNHKLYACPKFQNMSVNNRSELVKSLKLCYNCLNAGHGSRECKWKGCKKCDHKHNTLLHYDAKVKSAKLNSNKTIEEKQSDFNSCKEQISSDKVLSATVSSQILLSTAMIGIKDCNDKIVQARVVLDNGSQSNLMTTRFATLLGLNKCKVNIPVEGFDKLKTNVSESICATFYSNYNNYSQTAEFLVMPSVCGSLPNRFVDSKVLNLPKNVNLADPEFYKCKEIDALLGAEFFYELLCIGQFEISGHNARLQKTKLGWILAGRIGENTKNKKTHKCMLSLSSLHQFITRFWELEELPNKIYLSREETEVEEFFVQNVKRDPSGRYIVRLPFNSTIYDLGESYEMTKNKFYALERKLAKNINLKNDYINNMREAITAGHMIEYNLSQIKNGRHCFLPHHPVFKEDSTTTKLRIVYNASAKTSTGISLNDCQKVGAVVQSSSIDITLRFRIHQIILIADIEKMYKQVRLDEADIPYQLVFWREQENQELKVYAIPVVLFGNASAAHCATRALLQLTYDEEKNFSIAAKILRRDCYVDDVITGADNIQDAIKIRDELVQLTNAGGFILRKWMSNDSRMLQFDSELKSTVNLLTSENSEAKALGIKWNHKKDVILYEIKNEFNLKYTKRNILSCIAKLYDPIGLLGPIITRAKIIMQKLWQCNTGWDESIPHNVYTLWSELQEQLPVINKIYFDRKVIISEAVRIELHGFCDASEKAYGACVYVRSIDKNNRILTNLLCSKNRVAPLKIISMPKLELCAALLLSRLISTILTAFPKKIDDIFLWSDSIITLQWINTSPHLLKTFVANRVSEIQEVTRSYHWRHVSSQDNSADILSWGQLPVDFAANKQWVIGPEWLSLSSNHWPKNTWEEQPLPELKSVTSLNFVVKSNSLLQRFSDIVKLQRVVAYWLRYMHNLKNRKSKLIGPLSAQELKHALTNIIKLTQSECFSKEIRQLSRNSTLAKNSSISSLNPFINGEGILCIGSRLRNARIPNSEKYPIILPKGHHITKLLIRQQHIRNFHSGPLATLNAVRRKYWPIQGLNTTKGIIRACINCFREKPTNLPYFMGDLPSDRVNQARPFISTGVDYCGPFYVKEKKFRNRNKVKVYVAIFVCFATKAVHMEVVSELTTEAFLAALRRFFARRGYSHNIYSDNATNFVGAKNQLTSLFNLLKSKEHNEAVSKFLSEREINWHCIPPKSPHFGGLWEAAVKSFKSHFYRTVGDRLFTYEEFETYVVEVEGILNSRPLTPLSSDPNDLRPLTPFHFLIADSSQALPEMDVTDQRINRLSNWEHINYVKQHFWRRWYAEYLNQLKIRSKWSFNKTCDIKIGTMVLLKVENTPPRQWILGRISEVFPGRDQVIRVVNVRTLQGVYRRAITEIAPLPIY